MSAAPGSSASTIKGKASSLNHQQKQCHELPLSQKKQKELFLIIAIRIMIDSLGLKRHKLVPCLRERDVDFILYQQEQPERWVCECSSRAVVDWSPTATREPGIDFIREIVKGIVCSERAAEVLHTRREDFDLIFVISLLLDIILKWRGQCGRTLAFLPSEYRAPQVLSSTSGCYQFKKPEVIWYFRKEGKNCHE
jgi:hypothetical protein